LSPERQRLFMLIWICRARAVEELLQGVIEVERAVGRVALRLTDIGKLFWPGSVRALQMRARPGDTPELRTQRGVPRTWAEAVVSAEARLDEHLARPDLDDDGWPDAALLGPEPGDPDALLARAVAELDANVKKPRGSRVEEEPIDTGDARAAALLRVAWTLRWIRGRVSDPVAWGIALGRLRKLAPAFTDRVGALKKALE